MENPSTWVIRSSLRPNTVPSMERVAFSIPKTSSSTLIEFWNADPASVSTDMFTSVFRPISSAVLIALTRVTLETPTAFSNPLVTAALSTSVIFVSEISFPRKLIVTLATLLLPSSWPCIDPIFSANCTYGTNRSWLATAPRSGAFTTPTKAPPSRMSLIFSATALATRSWASNVEAPKCGVTTTFGWVRNSREASVGGSTSKVSKEAPATWPDLIASRRAISSTTPPLAQLIMRTPFLHFAMVSVLSRYWVSFVRGV
mmetsp:Transcript_20400/g.34153  ORF Transcript_20400/g.34153 Transcript_20400/m.34153 type:complete len:258 (-) Transcript_20400:798-1571(-)